MCILCVASRWSRRILAVLPWLVIPLILLWAVSQLLPPGLRFEVTSPRLACVFVLLFSLLWYEILMPRLSAWRERRNAILREKRRIALLEAAKWRKEATRRCRNCMTAYKDQNPGSGRFMCTYCGHVSRRPVLDISNVAIPHSSSNGNANNDHGNGNCDNGLPLPGSILQSCVASLPGDLQGKPVKVWDGKAWKVLDGHFWPSDRPATGTTGGGSGGGSSAVAKVASLPPNGCWALGLAERCTAEKSYSSVVDILLRILGLLFRSVSWIFRKIFRGMSSGEDAGTVSGRKTGSKKCEDGANNQCSKGEKARRRAEEKRQARLEREMLEEEERKQREEVARLVEERRRLRDEAEKASERQTVSEKGSERDTGNHRERESKKERDMERKRHEKLKEKHATEDKSHGDDVKKKVEKKDVHSKASSRHFGDSFKSSDKVRSTHDIGRSIDFGSKGTGSGALKTNVLHHLDNAKVSSKFSPQPNKTNSFWGKSFRATSSLGMKSSKLVHPINETAKQKTSSAWNNISWSQVWGKSTSRAVQEVSSPTNSANNAKTTHFGNMEIPKTVANGLNNAVTPAPVRVEQQPSSKVTAQPKSWPLYSSASSSPSSSKSSECKNQLDLGNSAAAGTHSSQPEIQSEGISNPFGFGSPTDTSLCSSAFSSSVVVSLPHGNTLNAVFPQSNGDCMTPTSVKTDFEDLSLAADAVSLLGPVSEALYSFSPDFETERSSPGQCKPISPPANRPRSAECPVSELLPSEIIDVHSPTDEVLPNRKQGHPEKQETQISCITEPWGLPSLTLDGPNCASENSNWTMWNAAPLGQSEITKLGELSKCYWSTEISCSGPCQRDACFTNVPSHCQPNVTGSQSHWLNQPQLGGMVGSWGGSDHRFSSDGSLLDEVSKDSTLALNHFNPSEGHPSRGESSTGVWPKTTQPDESSKTVKIPHVGGIYTTPDVQSVWSYK